MARGNLYSKNLNLKIDKPKIPTLVDSIEETTLRWKNFYEKQFEKPDVGKLPKMNAIENLNFNLDKIKIDVTKENVESALKKCKSCSAPGATGIS